MGAAILGGLTSPEVTVDGGVTVTNRTEAKAGPLRAAGIRSLSLETDPDANRKAVSGARIVVVGVKPPGVPGLLADVAGDLADDAIVVSVAAGVRIATMEAIVPSAVFRAMPNTPATVGRAVTGIAAGSRAGEPELELVTRLFETVGSVLVVPEAKIDALSTISGSGPAYVFYLVEQLTRTAMGLGFDEADARLMVSQTFLGAVELLQHADADPAELRRQVTSPNGTTERAIAVLDSADLKELFDRATAAALERARELGAETSR